MSNEGSAYRAAGVDIDAKYAAVGDSVAAIRSTFTPGVVGDVGQFGGLFDLAKVAADGQLLVASTDGVGTKVKVAQMAGRIGGVGHDRGDPGAGQRDTERQADHAAAGNQHLGIEALVWLWHGGTIRPCARHVQRPGGRSDGRGILPKI